MRKLYTFILTFVLCFSISSCTVNWFDKTFSVPWWSIAIPTVVLVLVVWVVAGKYLSKKTYVCPKCNGEFQPVWWKAALSLHINDDRIFRCPHCGKRSLCHLSYKNKR